MYVFCVLFSKECNCIAVSHLHLCISYNPNISNNKFHTRSFYKRFYLLSMWKNSSDNKAIQHNLKQDEDYFFFIKKLLGIKYVVG